MLAPLVIWSLEPTSSPSPKGGLVTKQGEWIVLGSYPHKGGMTLQAHASRDRGRSWEPRGMAAFDPDPSTDLGDGNAIQLANGEIWTTYRRNHTRGRANPRYSIEVSRSTDGARTWERASIVDASVSKDKGPSRGFWAPFLMCTAKGEILCFYDNEALPARMGFGGHQWITVRRWGAKGWGEPTIAAKAPTGLSRDGMPAVAEVQGDLLCVFEAVAPTPPHSGILGRTISKDGGITWTASEPLFVPRTEGRHAFAPAMAARGRDILVVFCTNEDRPSSPPTGRPPEEMNLEIKSIESSDGGKTWSRASLIYGGKARSYLPSLAFSPRTGPLLTWLDFDRGPQALAGRWERSRR